MSEHLRFRATLIGGLAILIWASLALLTVLSGRLPPFLPLSVALLTAGALGLLWSVRRCGGWRPALDRLRQPWLAWALGVGGLFGYHLCYFVALRLAPPVEANLLNYLWPLLIVLFSGLLPGERLRWFHLAGAALGLVGTALIVLGVADGSENGAATGRAYGGLAMALLAALTWSGYSVLNRRFAGVPTEAVAGFCLAGGLLALPCHLLFESPVTPTPGDWLVMIAMGLGPVGGAFFVWDHGTKHGDIRVLGALAYLAPLLSTLSLVLIGVRQPDWLLLLSCLLIVGGAALAGAELWHGLWRRWRSAVV